MEENIIYEFMKILLQTISYMISTLSMWLYFLFL